MDRVNSRRLSDVVLAVQRKWGVRALQRGGPSIPRGGRALSTGNGALDALTGMGGLPRGTISEFIGASTSGLHTLTFQAIGQAQARGEGAVYFDLANGFDADYAVRCGVKVSELFIVRSHTSVEALTIAADLIHLGVVGLLLWDAIPSPSRGQSEALFDNALRRLAPLLAASPTVFLVLTPLTLQGLPDRAGPLALHAALRLEFAHASWLWCYGDVAGYRTRVRVLRNRFGPEGSETEITIPL